jgi:hypothetical protein
VLKQTKREVSHRGHGWHRGLSPCPLCPLWEIRIKENVNAVTLSRRFWPLSTVSIKKKIETTKARLYHFTEGLCVQCMHIGLYDEESKTLKLMDNFIEDNDLKKDLSETRKHHEIYLSDPRKTEKEKVKTILRIPVKRK